jgi:hypothetical protein
VVTVIAHKNKSPKSKNVLDGGNKPVSVLAFPPMRYIIQNIEDLDSTDPIHANPNAKQWVIEDTEIGYICLSVSTYEKAVAIVKEWSEDEEDEANQ